MNKQSKARWEFLVNLAYVGAILAITYLVVRHLLGLVMPFVVAFVIVSLVNPLIRRMKRRFPKYPTLISFVFMLVLYVIIDMALFFGLMAIGVWVKDVASRFSENYFAEVMGPTMQNLWSIVSEYLDQLPSEWQQQLAMVQSSLMVSAQNLVGTISKNLLGWVSGFGARIPGFVISFVFTIMLSFFISMQYDQVTGFLQAQLPAKGKKILDDLKSIFGQTILAYISALLTLMIITAVEVSVGLTILGVEHSILIGIGVSIFDALPVFGTGAIIFPWAVIELIQGNFRMAIGLLILYGVVLLVRNIVEPKIVGDKLGINPIVSIVAIYIGFKLFGVFGMIFMPMTAQIILELDRRGTIHLFNRQTVPDPSVDRDREKEEELE